MRRISFCTVTAIVVGLSFTLVRAESQIQIPDSGKVQIVTMSDGSTLVGRIMEVGDSTFEFDGPVGKSTIRKSQVRQIKVVDNERIRGGKEWFANPNRSRLYLWPTGRTLNKGQGYFGDIYLFFPSVAYGFSSNFSIEGGISLFPGVDMDKQLMYLVPKIGVHATRSIDLAVSAILFRVAEDFDDWDGGDVETVGLLCGTGTFGSDDYSLSLGIGYGFADGDWAEKPAIMIGAEARVARRLALISENWISPGVENMMISYGCRFLGEKLSVDLALFNAIDEAAMFPGVPFISFIWSF